MTHFTGSFVAQEPRAAIAGHCDVSKKNRHRQTMKALTILNHMEFYIQWCFQLLLAGNSDP